MENEGSPLSTQLVDNVSQCGLLEPQSFRNDFIMLRIQVLCF